MSELEEGVLIVDRHLNGILKTISVTEAGIRMRWGCDGEGNLHNIRKRDFVESHVRFKILGSNIQEIEYAPYEGTQLWTDRVVEGEDGRFDVKKVLARGSDEEPVAFLLQQTHEHNKVLEEDQSREIYVDEESLKKNWEVVE